MRWGLELQSRAGVEVQLSFLENVGTIGCLATIQEDLTFDVQIRKIEGIEERQYRNAPFDVHIRQRKACAHRRISIVALIGRGMGSQQISRVHVQPENKIFFNRELP